MLRRIDNLAAGDENLVLHRCIRSGITPEYKSRLAWDAFFSGVMTMDIGRCFNDAMEVYKRNWLILALAALLQEVLSVFSLLILAGPIAGGVALLSLRALRREDKSVQLGDMFACMHKFLPLLGLFWITFIPIILGTILCVVPGLLLGTIWMFTFYLIVDKELYVFDALGASKDVVFWKGFGQNFLIVIITVALGVAPVLIPYVGVIIAWFLAPIGWLVTGSAYIQQVDEDTGDVARMFDPAEADQPAIEQPEVRQHHPSS